MVTIYRDRFSKHRDAVDAIAASAGIKVEDHRRCPHPIRCLPCAVITDDDGTLAGVVEWDEDEPRSTDIDSKSVDQIIADARASKLQPKAESPIEAAIKAVQESDDIEAMKTAVVAALNAIRKGS